MFGSNSNFEGFTCSGHIKALTMSHFIIQTPLILLTGSYFHTSKPFVKSNNGPPYELRHAGIIIILFLAPLLVCRASSIIYV